MTIEARLDQVPRTAARHGARNLRVCGAAARGRVVLYRVLLAVGWLACAPMAAGAQPLADTATVLASSRECVPDRDLGRDVDARCEGLGADAQTATPPASAGGTSPATPRDSIKNGLLIGAAVAAVVSIFASKMADCPDGADGRCPGTKALGIAITVATGAAIGAGIDLLLTVDASPGAVTPTGVRRRDVFVAGRISW